MLSELIHERTNSEHFFPSQLELAPDKIVTTWPVFGQRFIANVDNFFDESLLIKVNKDLHKIKCVPNKLAGNKNIVRVPVIGSQLPGGLLFPIISFDENCQLEEKSLEKCLDKENTPKSIVDLVESSLKKIAFMGGWSKERIPVTSFFLRYQLNINTPNVTNLDWHRDPNSLSITTVISPRMQDGSEFSGGNLLFAERTKDETLYFIPPSSNSVLADTVKTFTYLDNSCFIFENLWSQHKVSDIQMVSGDSCERILFSIFTNPNPRQLESFINMNKARNLV